MAKTWEEINDRIAKGNAVVMTAEEFAALAKEEGVKSAAKKVDVVTTGTFGPMCSTGVFMNFGHTDIPIRMKEITLNGVPASGGLAAVDTYLGGTEESKTRGLEYGGAHVIEDLIAGKEIRLDAIGSVTDCYPLDEVSTYITIDDLNQAYFFNPRNAYQNYNVAVNSTDRTLHTYLGTLLPNMGNAVYCSAGVLSPLLNDPTYRTIGIGTKCFVAGAPGYVAWQGTQHNPSAPRDSHGVPTGGAGTIAVIADLKRARSEFFAAASFTGYGVSSFVGIGIPIPVLDEDLAETLALTDADISATVYDYGVPSRSRPEVGVFTYAQLRSGQIEIAGKTVRTGGLSSIPKARAIANELKRWIIEEGYLLSEPVEKLPGPGTPGPTPLIQRGKKEGESNA